MIREPFSFSRLECVLLVTGFATSIATSYYVSIFTQQALVYLTGILGFLLLLYLLIWNFEHFINVFAFLIPMSVPFEVNGHVISLPGELILLTLGFLLIMRMVVYRPIPNRILLHPISLSLLSILLWMVVTTLFSTMPMVSMKRTVMMGLFVMVFYYYLSDHFSNIRCIRNFYIAYGIGLVIPVLWSIYVHGTYDFDMASAFHVNEPFYPEHTMYAGCLTAVLMILLLMRKTTQQWLWILPLLAILGTGIYLSFSRAAWLSILVAVAFFIIYKFRPGLVARILILTIFLIVVIGNLKDIREEFLYNRDIGYTDDIQEHLQSITNVSNDASNAERINRWLSAIEMSVERPWFGFGPGTYQFQYGTFQRRENMTRISTFHGDGGNAHSEYLNVLSEQGYMGLILFLILLYNTFLVAQRLIYRGKGQQIRNLSLAVFLALVTYFAHGIVNSFIDVDKAAALVFSGLAALASLELQNRGTGY